MSIVILKKFLNIIGLLNEKNASKITENYIHKLNITTDSITKKVFDLSGGNQQKVVIAKWLATEPKILIMDDPTRGIDVGAKAEIYQLIRNLAKEGIAILLSSSEIDEVLHLSHRIHIMRDGKLIKEYTHGQIDKVEIMRYISGDLSSVSR
jgi:ABC-type sugar transport system ATPase subunit